ncbi:hypothetical protein [Nitrosomonas sp. Nm132]|uniref:hypothetical protein n=1 Tax=Nitrosomonas sp. Nm132 TaxID=1881053 RepID=UPI0008905970|nr:hypothetical protein [Nitrosomonas sp. Nm132]SDH88565.1 hypothetical protein SAMN05428952_104016 [Nitrosomonas sp. Nm132]
MTLMTSRLISINYECNVKLALLLCLLLISLSTQAESVIDEQIRQLETSLLRIHQDQQNVFQQFQMKQELRRYELRQEEGITSLPQIGTYPQTGTAPMSEFLPEINIGGSPPSYEEMVKNKQERQKRIRQYTSDMDQLYTQYLGLEVEKKILMEQIGDLKRSKQEDIQ